MYVLPKQERDQRDIAMSVQLSWATCNYELEVRM